NQNWHANPSTLSSADDIDFDADGHALNNGLTVAGNSHTILSSSVAQSGTTATSIGGATGIAHRGGSGSVRNFIAWESGDAFNGSGNASGRHVLAGFAYETASLNATGQALLLN